MDEIGKQKDGHSCEAIYKIAKAVVLEWNLHSDSKIVDVGGGAGNFSLFLSSIVNGPIDVFDHETGSEHSRLRYIPMDLNRNFPVESCIYDACISLEVIEHLENPRHFMREIFRIVKPGGRVLISTPNQLSLSSKLCLLFKDQFQHFQDSCYPAHVSALVCRDLERIAKECGFVASKFRFTNRDRIPFTNMEFQSIFPHIGGKNFSSNILMVTRKP